ncbi:hypothetical protein ACHHYP_00744 [Achlya hypogyna]|uniref:Uncharacterized protein n=1 Tax=Achlya hypogyna TaxID=1202772 RepID=A0A1V9ZTU9_ACHHY|nr:hypothetical protein ACHHYP_00744 [Achlya hypogyna]
MAARVLTDRDLVLCIVQYQHGLPLEVRHVVALAAQVVITPCYTQTSICPSAYLSNIPPPYADLEYVQRMSYAGRMPNYALFLHDHYVAPALPLHLAIVAGNLRHVESLVTWQPAWVSPDAVALAAICGHLHILQYLATMPNGAPTTTAMDLAAMNGYLDVVEWLHGLSDGPGCTAKAMDGAAAYGHLDVVAFLHERRTEGCTTLALEAAIRNGYAPVADFLLSHRRSIAPLNSRLFIVEFYRIQRHRSAPGSNLLRTIQVLVTHNFTANLYKGVIHAAIESHGFDALQLLHESGIQRIDQNCLNTIIKTKDRASIEYTLHQVLVANDRWPLDSLGDSCCLWDLQEELPWAPWQPSKMHHDPQHWLSPFRAMDIAAALGDLPTVQLLHRLRLDCCSTNAMNHACARGHLDVAQWLHAHRAEGYTRDAMTFAAAEGHTEVIEWLHEALGMPCSEDVLANAAARGDLYMLAYLLTMPMLDEPAINGTGSSCTKFLPDGCVQYGSGSYAVDAAAANGHLEAVRLLQLHRASTDAMDRAALNGHLDVVTYLDAQRTEGCTNRAFEGAITGGHDAVLEFLIAHRASAITNCGELYVTAARRGQVATMAMLWAQLPWELTPVEAEKVVTLAALGNHVDMLQWLIDGKGMQHTNEALQGAERRGHARVVQLLSSRGRQVPSELSEIDFMFLM